VVRQAEDYNNHHAVSRVLTTTWLLTKNEAKKSIYLIYLILKSYTKYIQMRKKYKNTKNSKENNESRKYISNINSEVLS